MCVSSTTCISHLFQMAYVYIGIYTSVSNDKYINKNCENIWSGLMIAPQPSHFAMPETWVSTSLQFSTLEVFWPQYIFVLSTGFLMVEICEQWLVIFPYWRNVRSKTDCHFFVPLISFPSLSAKLNFQTQGVQFWGMCHCSLPYYTSLFNTCFCHTVIRTNLFL